MRQIKFRGQRIDTKEWVYGSLFYAKCFTAGTERYLPYIQVIDYERMGHDSFEVIPETIGQFTGLTDKNGKKIYEGDILKESDNFEVIWDETWCRFKLCHKRTSQTIQYPEWNRGIKMEIIGNIHNNPELIK